MRRLLFTVMASVALLAFGPAGALAKHRHHHGRAHHSRIRHERFGSDTGTPTTPTTGPTQPADQPAGTVDSFTNGVLTILLPDGKTKVSGTVTDATDLECQSAQPTTGTGNEGQDLRSEGGGDNGGTTTGTTGGDDNGGTTGGDQGDQGNQGNDQGDQGNDQGDNVQSCTTAALTQGTVVLSAELKLSSAGATWDKVELQQ